MLDVRFSELFVISRIYETRSLSGAARRLNITISAVSRALAKCQKAFADDLFVRNYRGMAPTEKCRQIMPAVNRILGGFGELVSEKAFDPAAIERTLSIASADNAVVVILRPVLRALAQKAPKMNFRLLPLADTVLRDLADGSVDLGLLPTSICPRLPEHYFGLNLFDVRRVCLVWRGHPLAERFARGEKLTRREFLKYPKIAVEFRQSGREPVFDVDTGTTRQQRKVIEMPHFLGAPYLLKETMATLVLPDRTAEFFARMLPEELAIVPIPGEHRVYSTRLIWHERNHASREMQWIRSMFVSILRPGQEGEQAVGIAAEEAPPIPAELLKKALG